METGALTPVFVGKLAPLQTRMSSGRPEAQVPRRQNEDAELAA
jgi:hypothetical protein